MKISEFLESKNILLDQQVSSKDDLFRLLADRTAASVAVPAEAIYRNLAAREELGTTGIGEGIAIPHVSIDGLDAPFGLLLRLDTPIPFAAVDEEPVDLVFFMLFPLECQAIALKTLAAISRQGREPEIVRKLRDSTDNLEIYRLLCGSEA